MPRVSVVIPLYNKASTIARTLKSISRQTFDDFEVIVVDDGSTDEGPALAAAHPDDRVRVIRQRNSGPGAARNTGASQAEGRYLAFLDADDEWTPGYLEEGSRRLEKAPEVAASVSGYFDCQLQRSSEAYWIETDLPRGTFRVRPTTPVRSVLVLLRFMAPWSTMVRAEVLRSLGGFYEREKALYGEDTYLWLKLLFSRHAIDVDTKPLVRFHSEDSDLSGNLPGPRPVEPFLLDPEELARHCAPQLEPLLRQVLQARAFKTACVLGYWGDWRRARSIRREFRTTRGWRLPLFLPSMLASTPVGPVLGQIWERALGTPLARSS